MPTASSLHASCVTWDGHAVAIIGASGSGKSALALSLMAMGCDLVADDRLHLQAVDGRLVASAPHSIAGLIEARGIGILNAEITSNATLVLAVDMDHTETERLPHRREFTHLGCKIPLIYRTEAPHFAPAILQVLKSGWSER